MKTLLTVLVVLGMAGMAWATQVDETWDIISTNPPVLKFSRVKVEQKGENTTVTIRTERYFKIVNFSLVPTKYTVATAESCYQWRGFSIHPDTGYWFPKNNIIYVPNGGK